MLQLQQGNQRWQIPRPATCQCLATFTPLKPKILIFFRDVISLIGRVFILLIDTATQEVPMKNIWQKMSSRFLRYAIELLTVAHVTNDVKWRPIVSTFGTLIDRYMTWLYFLDDFMSNVKEFHMLNVKYWRICCDVISLPTPVFIVSDDRANKEVHTKNIEHFLWLSFCDMTVPSKSNAPSLWPWPLKVFFSELITTL